MCWTATTRSDEIGGLGRCSHQPGRKVATSDRLSSWPPLSVDPIERLPRTHEMAVKSPAVL
jgi:hypothetical protein